MFKINIFTFIFCLALSSNTLSTSYAADYNIDASIITNAALSVQVTEDLNFGDVFFNPDHKGQILLGTNGKVFISSDTKGLTLSGATNAATIEVGGHDDQVIEISCDKEAALATKDAEVIMLTDTEIMINQPGNFGAGTSCNGLSSNPKVVDLSQNTAPTIFMGAALNIEENSFNRSEFYDSTNAGGKPVSLRIVYK